jgi:hypothetical protein
VLGPDRPVAWSSAGGRWRRLSVSYARRPLFGLTRTEEPVEGQVVRRSVRDHGSRHPTHWLVIDRGEAAATGFQCTVTQYEAVPVGSRVRARVDQLGILHDLELVDGDRATPVPSSPVDLITMLTGLHRSPPPHPGPPAPEDLLLSAADVAEVTGRAEVRTGAVADHGIDGLQFVEYEVPGPPRYRVRVQLLGGSAAAAFGLVDVPLTAGGGFVRVAAGGRIAMITVLGPSGPERNRITAELAERARRRLDVIG